VGFLKTRKVASQKGKLTLFEFLPAMKIFITELEKRYFEFITVIIKAIHNYERNSFAHDLPKLKQK